MKKKFFAIVVSCLATVFAMAQTENVVGPILTAQDLPAAELLLPAPPTLTSPLYYNDFVQYQNGKEIRGTERGKVAVDDAQLTVDFYMKRFGEAMGRELTPETYPALADYITVTFTTARLCIQNAKDKFQRQRPYSQFKEDSGVPGDEDPADIYHSYPSGHTIRAWSLALALVGIDPEHQNEILQTGYEMGQSRVIVGYHYQSDVEAARLCASAAYARIIIEPQWQEYFRKAKEEFNNPSKIAETKKEVSNYSNQSYTINGYPATENYSGVVVANGKKMIK